MGKKERKRTDRRTNEGTNARTHKTNKGMDKRTNEGTNKGKERSVKRPPDEAKRRRNQAKNYATSSQIEAKSLSDAIGKTLGDSGLLKDAPGRSRDAPGRPRNAPGALWERLGVPPGRPGASEKSTRELAKRLFRALCSDSRSQGARRAIFGRSGVARGTPDPRLDCALPVFRKGRAFLVRTAVGLPKRSKKHRFGDQNRPRSSQIGRQSRTEWPERTKDMRTF